MKLITTADTIEIVSLKDVIYIEAYQNYSKLHFINGEVILANDSLQEISKLDYPLFCRIHLSYIINLAHVLRYHKRGEVELKNSILLPVARRRKTEFIEKLHSVISNLLL